MGQRLSQGIENSGLAGERLEAGHGTGTARGQMLKTRLCHIYEWFACDVGSKLKTSIKGYMAHVRVRQTPAGCLQSVPYLCMIVDGLHTVRTTSVMGAQAWGTSRVWFFPSKPPLGPSSPAQNHPTVIFDNCAREAQYRDQGKEPDLFEVKGTIIYACLYRPCSQPESYLPMPNPEERPTGKGSYKPTLPMIRYSKL